MTAYTTPKSAFGTTLTWAGHDMGYIVSIDGPSIKADTIPFYSHDATSGWREKVAGAKDGGTVTIEVLFIPGDTTGQKYFTADIGGSERQVVITTPDSENWTFNAIATGLTPTFPSEGMIGATLTMEVTGAVTDPLQ